MLSPINCAACWTSAPSEARGRSSGSALLLLTSLVFLSLIAAGVRFPGLSVAQAVASRILCAATIADSCGDEPHLIAAYGSEVGAIAREDMPSLAFEHGSHGLPVDFRSCRDTSCGDGPDSGLVVRSDAGRPVTAFVHVIDCREGGERPAGADCSGERAGNLYVQYWTYYADSATLRGVPIAGAKGFHRDDWESVQLRIGPDGEVAERASSHHGYNYAKGPANAGSDAGIGALREIAETVGARPRNGWGPASGLLFVSGGSHAGNVDAFRTIDRLTPGSRVHLVPLEPVAAETDTRFAISAPWHKRVWLDPEAELDRLRASAELVGDETARHQVALGRADLDLAEAEARAAADDAGIGEQLDRPAGRDEVDGEADGRAERRRPVELDRRPGRGHRRGVDQGRDRAAVDHVADRHHLVAEGEGQQRPVVLDLAQLHPEVA